jgi:hypothetical protein
MPRTSKASSSLNSISVSRGWAKTEETSTEGVVVVVAPLVVGTATTVVLDVLVTLIGVVVVVVVIVALTGVVVAVALTGVVVVLVDLMAAALTRLLDKSATRAGKR